MINKLIPCNCSCWKPNKKYGQKLLILFRYWLKQYCNQKRCRIIENLRKKLRWKFTEQKTQIKLELDSSKINFLDVTLDLQNNTYHLFRKPNTKETYIKSSSNHPSNIKKELPKMIQHWLSYLSKNKHVFDEHKVPYEAALRNSGFTTPLKLKKSTTQIQRRKE